MAWQEITDEPEAPDPKLVALQAAACLIHMCRKRADSSIWLMEDIEFIVDSYIGAKRNEELLESLAKTIFAYMRRVAGVRQAQPLHQVKVDEARLLICAINAYDLWYCGQRRQRVANGEQLPPRLDWTKYNYRLLAGCVPV